jgi:hypothetical protein
LYWSSSAAATPVPPFLRGGGLVGTRTVDFRSSIRCYSRLSNVDGSPWIRNQVERQSLPLDALALGFYHLSEDVHKARREIYGGDDEEGQRWAGELLHVLKHDGYEAAWARLLEWRVALKHGRAAADWLVSNVSERREIICYPEFRAKGWQIGSGPTEATCKTLTARLKGSGLRWDGDNAEAIMALEALTQSGQFCRAPRARLLTRSRLCLPLSHWGTSRSPGR